MAEYLSPGVYVNQVPGSTSIEAVSASTGAMVGFAQRGPVGEATYVTSWDDYIRKFARGLESPFVANSALGYAVFGFFQNEGTKLYVTGVKGTGSVASTASIADATFTAKEPGLWGNEISVKVIPSEIFVDRLNVQVYYAEELVESHDDLDNEVDGQSNWVDWLSLYSEYIIGEGTLTTQEPPAPDEEITPVVLTGGTDGAALTDTDYLNALDTFSLLDDVTLVAIPGQTSTVINTGLKDFCEKDKYKFAILDLPQTATFEEAKAFAQNFSGQFSAVYYPWIRVNDPLSKIGRLREVPVAGHQMGITARIIEQRGVWVAPAGIKAVVRGAIEVVKNLTKAETDVLNPLCVNCIRVVPNNGICTFGARTLSPDTSLRYVSDVLLDIVVRQSLYQGLLPFVFEPHDSHLWVRVTTAMEEFLDTLWRQGAFKGDTAQEAYFAVCNGDLNPESTQKIGRLYSRAGYAQKKPAEFVICDVAHEIEV